MTIHALAGLPRSGSTLLGNLLAQHPGVYVSGTSSLAGVVDAVQGVLSNDPTVISETTADPAMYGRYKEAVAGLMHGWYADIIDNPATSCVIDKGRAWSGLWLAVRDLDPNAKMLFTVRDPRDVVASIERQHQATALFRSPVHRDLREAASQLMSPEGLVGINCKAAEDLIRRKAQGVMFIRYESFVVDPRGTMRSISEFLELDEFDFDPDHVESRGGDADEVWRGKYPHDGTGTIAPSTRTWDEVFDASLAAEIASVHPTYMATFAYQ